jgi:hypothetical protein
MRTPHNLADRLKGWVTTYSDVEEFPAAIHAIAEEHQPSRMPFFESLRNMPSEAARDSAFLGQIYLVYQAAMHATRVAVYYMPHLDNAAMRKRKLQIFVDDDGLAGGDTHHYQLARAFRNIGAVCPLGDEDFGPAEDLCRHLDPQTAHFVRQAQKLYARSLGPWCSVEMMSDDWIHALVDSLAVHFPEIVKEPYFADCFLDHVEERHAEESLNVTLTVLRARPELLEETLMDAKVMAEALDGVWMQLNSIVQNASGAVRKKARA